jgi:transcriptional regulator with XRE-family HTH domain
MATRERPADRGSQTSARLLFAIGTEIGDARRAAGLSQRTVAASARLSQSALSRIEHGRARRVSVDTLSRVLAVLGLRLSLKAYPDGDPIRDAPQRRLLGRLQPLVDPLAGWRQEVPVTQDPSDRRAWDAVLATRPLPTHDEAETQLNDTQALQRRLELKKRDGERGRLILLVADTRANRAVLRSKPFGDAFPVSGSTALAALARGDDPGGDAIVVL